MLESGELSPFPPLPPLLFFFSFRALIAPHSFFFWLLMRLECARGSRGTEAHTDAASWRPTDEAAPGVAISALKSEEREGGRG